MHTNVPVVTDNHHGFPYRIHRADNIIIHSIHNDFMYRSINILFYRDLIPILILFVALSIVSFSVAPLHSLYIVLHTTRLYDL